MFTPDWFVALGTVIVIDLVLSGDNAIVIGLAASGLPPHHRRKAILYGMIVATAARSAGRDPSGSASACSTAQKPRVGRWAKGT